MESDGPFDLDGSSSGNKIPPSQIRIRNAVILPDGTRREPLGSGVITGILGIGGMANVYEIWNSQLEVSRAVKLLHPNYTEEIRQRFQTEIKITAKLHHPNIVEIHAVGYWNGLPYIEMERIKGNTLEKLIETRGALPIEVCTSIALLIGRALRYAHHQEYVIYGTTYHGVIHRDLKPSNIMVPGDGGVKLMDFGIARPTDASIHTTDGAILGTMQYLSPEQLDGKEPDIRADIYSLGTIVYEILTGVKAFPEQNVSRLMISKIKNDFRPLDRFEIAIPPRLRRLVHRCMMYDREKRVPDAMMFLSEMEKIHHSISQIPPEQAIKWFLDDETECRTVISTRKPVFRRTLIAAAIVATVISGLFFGSRFMGRGVREDGRGQETGVRPAVALPRPESGRAAAEVASGRPDISASVAKPSNSVSPPSVPIPVHETKPSEGEKQAITKEVVVAGNVKRSFFELMAERYGTDDPMKIFTSMVQSRAWSDASSFYDSLDPQTANSVRGAVYRARTLRALGRTAQLRRFLTTASGIEDGELHLERARCAFEGGDLVSARNHLSACERTPAAFKESASFRLDRLHLEAQCAEREFEISRTEAARRFALDRWFEVKSELRTLRDHPWFREADERMQRITNL